MAKPWYDPAQLALSLGITLPLFLFYAWRIYSGILRHREALSFLFCPHLVREALEGLAENLRLEGSEPSSLKEDLLAALAWNLYEERLGSVRRSLRADVYTVILIGFLGTLIGVVNAFYHLSWSLGAASASPSEVVSVLLRGGLATALISSLVASVMAGLAMTYLSHTERRAVQARDSLLRGLLEVCR